MIGGKGSLTTGGDGLKIGSANGEIDVISPGHGISSSLSSTNSQQQVSLGNGSDSTGTFTVTNLNLNQGESSIGKSLILVVLPDPIGMFLLLQILIFKEIRHSTSIYSVFSLMALREPMREILF